MKPRVKICGITNAEDALYCANAGADALGFIFYEKSPRYIDPGESTEIIGHLPPFIVPVGIFVNEKRGVIERTIVKTGIRVIQLSGDERPEDCLGYSVKVVKAFRINNRADIEKVSHYTISAAMLDGAKDGSYGGSGSLADFSIALEMKRIHPLILAGGLNPDNVPHAIQTVQPYAIDVNSGVEIAPGKKDHVKVDLLFERLSQLT